MVKLNKKNRKHYTKLIKDALHANHEKAFREIFLDLHPFDQASMFASFNQEQRKKGYDFLTSEEFALLFENLSTDNQILFFHEMEEEYSSEMLNNMFTDDVVMFLTEVNGEAADQILETLEEEKAETIEILLSYEPETAGAVMTKEFVSITSTETAENVIKHLREEAPSAEVIYYNYVVDEVGTLVGVVSLRDVITAPENATIENIMNRRDVSVPDDMDQGEVASVIQKYDLLAVPVISKQSRLLGIVTVDDVIDIIEDETTEDFGEISAAKGATDVKISAVEAAKKRSPWIIALMFFGLITAGVIGQFEDTLEQVVLLAAFVPMIMDSAGNVGTQSLTVSVRGLALGTVAEGSFFKMIRREFRTGLMIGLICMVLISVIIPVF